MESLSGARLLVVTAVPAERAAVIAALPTAAAHRLGPYDAETALVGAGEVVTVSGGVGPAAAAAVTATAIALDPPYDMVFSCGIGGGFSGRAQVGDVVVADSMIAADLGADSPTGPIDLATLGFGEISYPVPTRLGTALAERLTAAGLGAVCGPVLTVSTATGTADRAAALADRFGAVAEAMEGFGVRTAAAPHGVAVAELRAVSNVVGIRDLRQWDIPRALRALTRAVAVVLAEPLPLPL